MRISRLTAACLVLIGCGTAWTQAPQQVQVSVKVVEFQTDKDIETGLSAYFKQRLVPQPYGRADSPAGSISASDITFPAATTSGITVFLDRLVTRYGDIEIVLQGLVDQGRAFILSQPTVLVPVGPELSGGKPTVIKTTQKIPYEDIVVVGSTARPTTTFRETGVILDVTAIDVIDDDGNPSTKDDTYINLKLTAKVEEAGQRITVALDDTVVDDPEIQVPEFVTRTIITEVWVRHGQVLMLGGLYRNTEDKDLATLPWLTQGDRFMNGLIRRAVPFGVQPVPLSSSIGNNKLSHGRRELIFLIKADVPTLVFDEEVDFEAKDTMLTNPTGILTEGVTGVLESLGQIPKELGKEVTGESLEDDITEGLGAEE